MMDEQTTEEDQNKSVNSQQGDLDKCKSEAQEYVNNWKKERADFLNYKKDEIRKMEEFARFANEDLLLEIIEVLDDLLIARKNAPPGNTEWLKGLDNAMKKFDDLLKKYGMERIAVDGAFDPLLHEAVEGTEGDKLEELRAGYTMHGRVVRPARVKIIK